MTENNTINAAVAGAALAPICAEEKRTLAILCRRAWDKLGKPGESFDAWRHQQVLQCVERSGLRQCRHEDFNLVKAQMLRILGQAEQADRADLRAVTERRRQALAKLHRECAAAAYIERPMDYVRAIAKSKFRTADIEADLAENQIWQLIFHLRKADSRRRQAGNRRVR
jgi:uncharacterized protein YifE (UPF0438 family)